MVLFGSNDREQGIPDHSMQEVLDAVDKLGLTAPWTLSPQDARKQPTPADGAKEVMRQRGIDPNDDMGIATKDFEIPGPGGPIKARLYGTEDETSNKPVVVYFHGGGWVIADLDVYDATPRALAKATDCIFVSCHYRQAPEDRFPAAHEDAWAAWEWVTKNAREFGGDGEHFAVMGESAGGNLAANVSIRARDMGSTAPMLQVLIYPIAASATNSPSYDEQVGAKPLNKPFMEWFFQHYLENGSARADRRINLVDADLKGLPPTTIIAAEIDPLRSEGEVLADRLKDAGNDVGYTCYDGVTHEFFGMGAVVKDAAAAQAQVAASIKKEFGLGGILEKLADALG